MVGVVTADLPNVSLIQTGAFAQVGAANGITVAVTASLAGTAANNYLVTQPASLSANITKKTLTVVDTAVANKVYNGSTAAVVTAGSLFGVVSGDGSDVVLTRAATFTSANAGTAVPVTMSNSISGAASANYTLVQPTGIVANITPAPLGIFVAATYSGSTTIIPATFTVTGLVNSETITGISSAVLNSMNVSANSTNFVKSVTISSGTANASNYAFNTIASSTAGSTLNAVTLSAKTLTVAGTIADKKVYDGTNIVSVWGGKLVGVIGIDAVVLKQTGTLDSVNVGSAVPVTMTSTISGFSAANYTLVQPTGITAVITPKSITISDGTVANKVYDGTTNAVITGGSLVGVLTADASNVILTQAGRFSSPNVSNGIIIIASGSISGSAASNYTLVQPAGITANITPAMLGISVIGLANGTNNITPISFTINGLINGQTITSLSTVNVKSSSISSNGSNFVTGIVISGGTALATNYAFSPVYSGGAGIDQNTVTLVNSSQKIVTVTGAAAASKVYDGTTSITITGGTLVGVVGSDSVTLVRSGALVSANVSLTAAVALNYSLTGVDAANYILVQPTGVTAIVTQAPIGIALTGTYNSTTTIIPTAFTITGLVNSETVTGLSSATLSAFNVADNGSNYVSSITSSGGTASLSNYKITQAYNATAGTTRNTATITAKALTVGGVSVAANKVYDGSTTASISGGSLVGVVGSDVVTLNQLGSFAQSTVGDAISITSSSTLSGLSSTNYSVTQPTGITANITPKALTVTGLAVSNKVYDGSNTATVAGGSLSGLVGSDGADVSLSQSATFATINVGNAIVVTSVASISGAKAANYTLTQPDAVSANITAKALTVSGAAVSNKTFDKTTAASFTAGSLVGVVSADTANVTLTRAGVFSSANVGTAVPVISNFSIAGSAASNYTLTQPTGVAANITAKSLTITANDVSSTYGNTTSLGSSAFTQSGLLTGDAITAVTLQYSGSNAVAATVNAATYANSVIASAATGSGLSNYAISYEAGDLVVSPATLTLTPVAKSAVYSGATLNAATYSANAANYLVAGYKNTDSASNTTLSFTGALGFTVGSSAASVKNAGTYGYTAGDLAVTTANTNYAVVLNSTLSNQYVVTPASVTLSARKVYDGSASFVTGTVGTTLAVATGIGSETLTVSGSATANSANVMGVSSLSTTGLSLVDGSNGGLASNYILPARTGDVAITPKSITVSIADQTKQYDTTTAATLVAGTALANGSYDFSGFVGGDGAYITQTAASYNSANVASATTVNAVIGSSYVAKGGAMLSNYSLPVSASGVGTITKAPLTMTADDASTYMGVTPVLTHRLTGLIGADTAGNAVSSPAIAYDTSLLATARATPYADALEPSATSSNYSLTFVKGALTVVGNSQMLIRAGSNTTTYGVVNSGNVSYLGDGLSSSNNIVAGYCTDCSSTNFSPTIINLTLSAPAAGSNVWTATDALGTGPGTGTGRGQYTFVLTPTIPGGSYSAGNNLNVGNYVLTPSNLNTVTGYTTNYDVLKPIIYSAGSLSITPKTLTVTSTSVATKAYDGTNVASLTGGVLNGVAAGDTSAVVNLVQSGSFASINKANGIAVATTSSLAGTGASNYVLTQPTGLTGNITAASVVIGGLSVANKVYDSYTTATISGTPVVVGLIGSDTATATASSPITATFAQSDVGNNLVVTPDLSNLSLNNSNYVISGVNSALVANITAAPITVSAAKTYDGTNSVSAGQMTIAGVAGQTLTFTVGTTGTLSSPNVGSASLSSLSNPVLVSATGSAGNYSVIDPVFSTVTITPASITVGLNSISKVYDASTSTASATTAPTLLLVSGTLFTNQATGLQDALSGGAFAYTDVNVGAGNKIVNPSGASVISGTTTISSNYSITYQANTTSTISPAPVIIGGLTASNKTYNNNTVAVITGTPTIASGLLSNETSNLTGSAIAGIFADSNVGTGILVTPTLSGLTLSNANYYVAGVSSALTANITAAPLTISGITAANKVYDTTTAVTLSGTPVIDGLLSYTNATVSGSYSGAFGNANVGTAKSITPDFSGLTLSNSNYYIAGLTNPVSADITAAPLMVAGLSASNKVYNVNATASLTGTAVVSSGLLGSDVATLSGSATAGTFASADVGTGIVVTPTLSNLTLSNSNYYIAGHSTALTADITPAPVTISGLVAANKVYDTTTDVTVSGTRTLSGLLNNENVTISGSMSSAFVGADAGTGIAVSVGLSGLSLSNSNYYIAGLTSSLSANIAPAPLVITADSQTMVYGSPTPTLTYTFTGLLGSDSDGFTGALASNASSTAAVGNAYVISQGTLTPSSNYRIDTFNTAGLTITPRPVTVIVNSGQYKVYGNADPSAFTTTIQVQGNGVGLIAGETLSGSLVRAAGENAGVYPITQGTLVSANPNYAVTVIGNDFAITARPITVTATAGQTKVYGDADGVLAYTVSTGTLASFGGVTDVLIGALARAPGNNVGNNYAINAGSLTSASNPNYDITFVGSDYQTTARPISLSAPVINKVYDGGYTYDLTAADLAIMNQQLVGSDTFNTVKAVFSGNNPNVGTGKTIEIDAASVSISDGNSGRNYSVSSVNSLGNITPASLTVRAANDARFAIELQDTVGYAGALYSGFVNGETIANLPSANRTLQISRSDASNNAVGTYTLTPSGHGAQGEVVGNYLLSYINGEYKILGPQDLLIRAAAVTSYGSIPTYSFTAKYVDANGGAIAFIGANGLGMSSTAVTITSSGSTPFTLNDGLGGTLTTAFAPLSTSLSVSGNVNAGQYNVSNTPNPVKAGFANLTVVGSLAVEPLVITVPTLSPTAVSKVYDGNTAVLGEVVNITPITSQILAGDLVGLSVVGFYDNKNVGTGKNITLNFGLNGSGISNYTLSANRLEGQYGAITQLASVAYIGPVGGNWSDPNNWAGGAIPDLSNVANVIIPTVTSVSYDAAVAGPVTSQVAANGSLSLASAGGPVSLGGISGAGAINLGANTLSLTADTGNFAGALSGTGGLTIKGGSQTLSGSNTYTGNTVVDTGASLIISGAGTLGGGSYAGTITNNGSFTYASTATQTISGVVSGSGGITKENTGTLILGAANTYTGATSISGGTITITDAAALGANSGGTTINTGGTLDLRNVTGVTEPITVNGGTLSTSTGSSSVTSPLVISGSSAIDVDGTQLTLTGIVSGTGSFDKTGAGTLVLEAANTYTGATSISGGTIAITDAAALGATSGATTINTGGTLDLRGVTGVAEPINLNGGTLSASTGNNSITGAISLLGNSNSAIDVDGTSLTISSVISGTGSFDKTGAGTLVLEGANTYTGETTIDAGRLTLAAGASIAESERVTVGANGIFDTSAITANVYINSLAGSGSVINGSTTPNSLVINDAIPGDVFSGVISGSGGLTIAGGTQTLTGINTYSGPTVVDPGANLIAAIQSIPGDVVNNGSFGFNQSTAGSFTHNMSGSGTMVIGGTGVITLTGTNTQAGGTRIDSGASLMIGSANALSGNQVESNNGSFGITDGIVLSSLGITGTVTLTSDIYTTGAQSYNNVKLAPSADNLTTLQTVNSDISITGTLDATVGKIQSILINAGTGKVTFGDSIGSIARPNKLTVTGSRIFILADILTGDKQEYNGATSIGDGTYLGKALVKGFLYDSHYQYFEYAKDGVTSKIDALRNDPRYIRTLVSKDPTVTFNGTVDDVAEFTHTLLVAAIAANTTSALAASTMPIINFNDSVSNTIPLYSLNVQTVASANGTNNPDLTAYVGQINLAGNVTTYSNQVFHTASMPALNGSQPIVFSVYDPNASVSFLLPPARNGTPANPNITVNGQTNLDKWVSGFKQNAALGYKEELTPAVRSLATTAPAVYRSSGIDGGAIRSALDYHADMTQMSIQNTTLSAVTVSSPKETEVLSNKPGAGKSNKSKTSQGELCATDANGDTECEDV